MVNVSGQCSKRRTAIEDSCGKGTLTLRVERLVRCGGQVDGAFGDICRSISDTLERTGYFERCKRCIKEGGVIERHLAHRLENSTATCIDLIIEGGDCARCCGIFREECRNTGSQDTLIAS